jgi:hypothetical protein
LRIRLRIGGESFAMLRSRLIRFNARWPFWLLLAAWFCANSPQAATYEVIVWFGQARSFSHQERLSSEVASILAGGTKSVASLVADRAQSAQQPSPSLPFNPTLKKIDVLFSDLAEPSLPPVSDRRASVYLASLPAGLPPDPPAEPPRGISI